LIKIKNEPMGCEKCNYLLAAFSPGIILLTKKPRYYYISGLSIVSNSTRSGMKALPQHSIDVSSDFAADIYAHLTQGKLVIID